MAMATGSSKPSTGVTSVAGTPDLALLYMQIVGCPVAQALGHREIQRKLADFGQEDDNETGHDNSERTQSCNGAAHFRNSMQLPAIETGPELCNSTRRSRRIAIRKHPGKTDTALDVMIRADYAERTLCGTWHDG